MQFFTRAEDFPKTFFRPLVLALGFFDGLHLGHQKILKRVTESARENHAASAVFTFQNHPQQVLNPDAASPFLITTLEQKKALLQQSGIEFCFLLPFTEEFSKMDAGIFVKDVLLKQLQVKKVCLGYNAHFGKDRKGNTALMRELSAQYPFEFEEIGPVEVAGEAVSSSRIRKLIQVGELALASECLGRPYRILGQVVKGEGRGSKIGFPTANFETSAALLPPQGVYPVQVRMGSEQALHAGVLNFGTRPTFKEGAVMPVWEVFLLDYQGGSLYGASIEVIFHSRLREERAFSGIPELQAQIAKDVEAARRYFSKF